jgi:hypothetical protein
MFFERKDTMGITVNDPGYKNGRRRVPNQFGTYEVTIERDGAVIDSIIVSPYLYPLILGVYVLLQISGIFTALNFSDLSATFSWGGALVTAQLVHLAFSFKNVRQDELAGILFFQKPVQEVGSGLKFLPLGLLQLTKFQRSPIQIQFPGDPEKVYKGTDEEYFKLPLEEREKFVLPIRVLSGSPEATSPKIGEVSILETQMTIEIDFYIRWVIEHFWVFLTRIGSVGEANRQQRDSAARVASEAVALRTPARVNQERGQISESMRTKLEEITQDWGVSIVETALLPPDITRSVNQSIRDVAVEKAKARQKVIAAEAEQVNLTLLGDGNANAKRADLQAMADGAKALGVDGQDVIDLEKTKSFRSATVFIDGGSGTGNLFGLGAKLATGANSALSTTPPKSDNTDTKE